jgi:hypothetical protein
VRRIELKGAFPLGRTSPLSSFHIRLR